MMSSILIPLRTRWLGAGVVVAGVLFQAVWLGLPAMFVSVMLVISYGLWVGSNWCVTPQLKIVFSIGVIIFLGHAAEEYLTGLHEALPELFGRAAWSDFQYLVFNGVWALVFSVAAITVKTGRSLPVLIILFFAIAGGVGNGVLHLLLVMQRGAYFPGAWTALLCFIVGVWLLRLLYVRPLQEGNPATDARGPGTKNEL